MRKRTRNVVAVVLAGLLMAMASPAAAQAEPTKGSESYTVVSLSDLRTRLAPPYGILNHKSEKALQPGSATNGSVVTQQTPTGINLQRWDICCHDGNYVTFWNAQTPRLNMGIDGASTAPGAAAIVANGAAHFNQDFDVIERTATEFNLKNRHSGLCLGIDGASENNGARAMQFACSPSAPNQNWSFIDFI
ncbi:RICIN domain-containing protein [Phytohabitans sp. LJ34]|uniref:RICIN domain-containing protein n=1 Tax=Phytohabitans sp. LJ34 TaxID=3452217 RepID=UPI003F89D3A0